MIKFNYFSFMFKLFSFKTDRGSEEAFSFIYKELYKFQSAL